LGLSYCFLAHSPCLSIELQYALLGYTSVLPCRGGIYPSYFPWGYYTTNGNMYIRAKTTGKKQSAGTGEMGQKVKRKTCLPSSISPHSMKKPEHKLKGQQNIRGGQDKQIDVFRLVVPRLLWNGCLRDNATTVSAAITLISRDGIDGSGTCDLGLRSVKGDEG